MFFIPLGIFSGADVTWSQFVLNNLLIVTAGNIVGGALFVGIGYSFVYAKK
jgi:formate/nitrite transporter FocA (FNT family)